MNLRLVVVHKSILEKLVFIIALQPVAKEEENQVEESGEPAEENEVESDTKNQLRVRSNSSLFEGKKEVTETKEEPMEVDDAAVKPEELVEEEKMEEEAAVNGNAEHDVASPQKVSFII